MCRYRIHRFLKKQPSTFWAAFSIITVGLLSWIDSHTSHEFEFSAFYLIPICLVTWYTRLQCGLLHSVGCLIVSNYIDFTYGHPYTRLSYLIGNEIVQSILFVSAVMLINELRKSYRENEHLASTDSLTGAYNGRMFRLFLQMEIERFRRTLQPFTVVLFDIDDFKRINDTQGHPTGDRVLCLIVNQVKRFLRRTDIVSRIGGDEFAILLSNSDQNVARMIVTKITENIRDQTSKLPFSITVSAGALTCIGEPLDPDIIISTADTLQYNIKHSSKNSIQFSFYPYTLNSRGDIQ